MLSCLRTSKSSYGLSKSDQLSSKTRYDNGAKPAASVIDAIQAHLLLPFSQESSDILVFWRGNSQLSTLMPKTDLQTVRLKHEIVVAEPTNDEQAIEEEEDHDVIKHEDPQGEKIDAANQGEDPEEGLAKDEEDVADESTSVALNPKATHTEPRDPSTTNDCKAP